MLLLAGCFRDDGIVKPTDRNEPLASFVGSGVGDKTSDPDVNHLDRLVQLRNPRIALVWQFLGPKEYVRAPSSAVVEAEWPYEFKADLWDPPGPEVLDNPDLAIAQFWLYADRNDNGVLDRLVHPDMAPVNAYVDSLYRVYHAALAALVAESDVRDPVETRETYYLAGNGTVTMRAGGHEDTLWVPRSAAEAHLAAKAAGARPRNLSYLNKWETFFLLRKRDNEYVWKERPEPGYAKAIEFSFRRRLFPQPGREREHQARCTDVIEAHNRFVAESSARLGAAVKAGLPDYPYVIDPDSTADFVLGRSRSHFILYLKDEANMEMIRLAERRSSFNVRGLERLKTGYNLITCDDQYRCELLPPDSRIRLDLGANSAFFQPPASPVEAPIAIQPGSVARPVPVPLGEAALARFAGHYEYFVFQPLWIGLHEGSLWADIPDVGPVRLTPGDSLAFFTPFRDLQLEFVPDPGAGGRMQKVFVVKGSLRYVGVRDSLKDADSLAEKVRSLVGDGGAAPGAGLAASLAGTGFDYGGDTLQFRVADGNLEALVPGLYAVPLRARDDSTLFSTELKLDLTAGFDTAGRPIGLRVGLHGRQAYAPAFGHEPPDARALFPGLPDSLPDTVAREEGSARDLQPTLDGKRTYAYSGDSTFLKAGDGWVAGMRASKAEIAMGQGGDHLLMRLPGLKGKAATVTFTFHPERGAGRRRVRLSFRGGASADHQDRMLAGDVWIVFDGKPVQATWGPFPVPDDDYHVRLEQVPTADAAVGYAVGSYSVQTD
jgi:hypothetical protein